MLAALLGHEFILNAEGGGPYDIRWTIDGKTGYENVAAMLPCGKVSRQHPIHLHGQFFKLPATDGEPAQERFWRDTLRIGP